LGFSPFKRCFKNLALAEFSQVMEYIRNKEEHQQSRILQEEYDEMISNIILMYMKNDLAKADLHAGILPLDKSSGNSKSSIIKTWCQ
jgi:hypothetical protein